MMDNVLDEDIPADCKPSKNIVEVEMVTDYYLQSRARYFDDRIHFRVDETIKNLSLQDTYTIATASDNVAEARICSEHKKYQRDFPGTPAVCETILANQSTTQFTEGNIRYVEIVRVKNPNLPAFVTLSGRRADKSDRPERIDIAHADRPDWHRHKADKDYNRPFTLYKK